jgi:hypothetical protein
MRSPQKRLSKEQPSAAVQNEASLFLARKLLRLQTGFSRQLSRWEQKMTLRQKKVAFCIFFLVAGGLAVARIYSGFSGKVNALPFRIEHRMIVSPAILPQPDSSWAKGLPTAPKDPGDTSHPIQSLQK